MSIASYLIQNSNCVNLFEVESKALSVGTANGDFIIGSIESDKIYGDVLIANF